MPSVILLIIIGALGLQEAQPPAGAERGAKLVGAESDAGLDATYTARHALVIGIDKYDDAGFPRLGYAVADSRAHNPAP